MWSILHLSSGSLLDLVLIILAFSAGRLIQLRDTIYLVIFLLRIGMWVVQRAPIEKRNSMEGSLKEALLHMKFHHRHLMHDKEAGGVG